jgi:hypothetical protein
VPVLVKCLLADVLEFRHVHGDLALDALAISALAGAKTDDPDAVLSVSDMQVHRDLNCLAGLNRLAS